MEVAYIENKEIAKPLSEVNFANEPLAKPAKKLPAEAQRFVGTWNQASTDNYEAFLKEVVGLSWATRKIGSAREAPRAGPPPPDGEHLRGARRLV